MKKIDLSKTIGFVKRGGLFSPSNEKSQQKIDRVWWQNRFNWTWPMDSVAFLQFKEFAKQAGYEVMVIERGLMR